MRVLSVFLRASFFLFLLFPTPCHAGYNSTKSYRANFSHNITLYICTLLKEIAYHNVLERLQKQVARQHYLLCWYSCGYPALQALPREFVLEKVAFVTTFAKSSRGYPRYAGYPVIIINL